MQALWGDRRRIGLWRRLWLALMQTEKELGLKIPDTALTQLRAHLDDADLDKAAEYERRVRHDVMAHIHHLGDQAPAARPFIHLGATSAYVTDNADLVLMREGMQLLLGRIGAVLVAMGKVARRCRAPRSRRQSSRPTCGCWSTRASCPSRSRASRSVRPPCRTNATRCAPSA